MRYIKTLQKLRDSGELNFSALPKALLKELLDEDLVYVKSISANRKKVKIKEQFLEYYLKLDEIQNATCRAELILANSDTKKKKISPQDGLYIAGRCKVDGRYFSSPSKSSLFLKELPMLDKSTLVVGVENFENLIYFENQLKFFTKEDILFVYRNKKMLELFEKIDNKIIYFGDFDLCGIVIYLNEILPRNKNIEFFIPDDIEKQIRDFGSRELYIKQLERCKNLSSSNAKIQKLISTIHRYQKALEQEFFILKGV